ncbi:hypothetical protein BDP81DRAFT_79050 [Colletotrichum phormii]|uniref:Uncharacterized protein n=1 Tax=Colletotrichum phormii TaxID=359342 RepID=A0AAJ0A0G9_9PEZI|nr:uncharacterized protein BDP81DRAFT_79050 [Colletotrichum phormii]KAK1654174.1 hypothetical protein BDP81DRAFT_79050 [Colletotrichum phormii]
MGNDDFSHAIEGEKSTRKTSEFVVENDRGLTFAGGRSRWVWSMDCRCGMRTSNVVGAADRKNLGPWWCCRASFAGRCRCSSLPDPGDLVGEPILQSLGLVNQQEEHHTTDSSTLPIPAGPAPKPNMAAPSTFSRIQHCGTSPRVGTQTAIVRPGRGTFDCTSCSQRPHVTAAALHRVSLSAVTHFTEVNDTS